MINGTDKSFLKFLILCSGGFIAALGSGMTSFALGIYVFTETGLVSAVTLITLFAFLPGLLLSPLAGILADRYDRRLLMIIGDGFSALGILYILFCMQGGQPKLWQICVGVTISSAFSSLVEPAFKATISDLLTEKEYSKASGLVQLSGSAKLLISPLIAGVLLKLLDIKILLIIDICTIAVTVITTLVVRKGLVSSVTSSTNSIINDFKIGWQGLIKTRGVFILAITGIGISFFLGCIQSLYTPMVLGFADSSVLGIATTVCASGMLFSSIFLGIVPIKKGFAKILSTSLFCAGICMIGFGLRENMVLICVFGFFFFVMLPLANTSIDYLIRTNISNDVQGRVWGLIGIISQFGFVIAYALLGPLADHVFVPLLLDEGPLANSIGKIIGVGPGRGIGFLIIIAGILLSITAIILLQIKSVRRLENQGELCIEKS